MQFVVCKFRDTDARSYTYRNDGEHVAAGDYVKVPDAREDGFKRVLVVDTYAEPAPVFATKAILGKCEDEPASAT